MREGEPTNQDTDVRARYAQFDFSREPFERRKTSIDRIEDPAYPEIDEAWVMELEEKTFHPQDHFPKPPETLTTDHPVQKAWKDLLEAEIELKGGVDLIRETHDYFRGRIEAVARPDDAIDEEGAALIHARSHLQVLVKKIMRNHLREKKSFFHRALAYLYLFRATSECQSDEDTEELFHQVESIFIGHMTYAAVRSATHIYGARRQNGDLVMDHTYSTCVDVMNRYRRRIQEAKTIQERAALYEKMKKGMMVAICHDYLEDFEEMTPEFLEDKMTEHHTLDTTVEAPLRRTGCPLPKRTNPFTRNKQSILNCLQALTKPPKGSPDRTDYLRRQVQENTLLSEEEQILATEVKCADRLHNLNTLSAKPLEKQIDYLVETLREVTPLAETVMKSTNARHLSDDLFSLYLKVADLAGRLIKNRTPELIELGKKEQVEALRHLSIFDRIGGLCADELLKDL